VSRLAYDYDEKLGQYVRVVKVLVDNKEPIDEGEEE